MKQKKRAILYLTPGDKMVRAGFALGEKAAVAAETSGLPARVLQLIDNAPRYAEGRGVRLELEDLGDVGIVLTLAQIKMSH